jgi:hypothetical protein
MPLIILILIAVLVGYFLARTPATSKPIDSAATTVADGTKSAASKTTGWLRGLFGRNKSPKDEVIDIKAETAPAPAADPQPAPAEKQSSRRKEETASGEPPAAA